MQVLTLQHRQLCLTSAVYMCDSLLLRVGWSLGDSPSCGVILCCVGLLSWLLLPPLPLREPSLPLSVPDRVMTASACAGGSCCGAA